MKQIIKGENSFEKDDCIADQISEGLVAREQTCYVQQSGTSGPLTGDSGISYV